MASYVVTRETQGKKTLILDPLRFLPSASGSISASLYNIGEYTNGIVYVTWNLVSGTVSGTTLTITTDGITPYFNSMVIAQATFTQNEYILPFSNFIDNIYINWTFSGTSPVVSAYIGVKVWN